MSGAIGLVAVPPVLLGTAYGIWKENQLDKEVWQVIDERVSAPPQKQAGEMPADTPAPTATPQREQSIRVPVLRGLVNQRSPAGSPHIRGMAGGAGSQLMRACPVPEQGMTMAGTGGTR